MDLIIYILVFGAIGIISCAKNGGLVIEEKSGLAQACEDSEISYIVDSMTVGSNPECHYNDRAFMKILEELKLI